MSNVVLENDGPAMDGMAIPAIQTLRRALYLRSQERPVFAWLHQAVAAPRKRHAILVCAPAGHEEVHSHRSLRHLADRLASAGFDVIRFDFLNTGDSADLADSLTLYADWLANIRDVLSWMKDELKCSRVSIMGLRLGATLAFQAAVDSEVESLILWQPIVRGRAYVRELTALSLVGAPGDNGSKENIESAGFVFSRPLLEELGKIDLINLKPKCGRVLVVSREDAPVDVRLLEHLQTLGIPAEGARFNGFAEMMAEPHCTSVPHQTIATTLNWLERTEDSASNRGPSESSPEHFGLIEMASSAMVAPRIRESAVTFGDSPTLFGILCEPERNTTLPLVILSNAGATYHVGPGRLYVMLARQLAAKGFRCLRIDLAGLGDSVLADNNRENDSYPATAFRDINTAIRFSQRELRATRVIVMGLCSGAYVAFQSLVQMNNPGLIEAILVNPLTFYWKEGMKIEDSASQRHIEFQYYKNSAFQPSKWLKLLSGKTRVGIVGAIKLLAGRLGVAQPKAKPVDVTENHGSLGHPVSDDLTRDLFQIQKKSGHLACFFSRSDPGWSLMTSQAGRIVKELCDSDRMSVHFVENADHTFSRQLPRKAFLDAVITHLNERYGPT